MSSDQHLIIFDTCTLPEYYNDVHKILAYPRDYIITYDYRSGHIEDNALQILDKEATRTTNRRVVLAYIQSPDYEKAAPHPPPENQPLPAASLVTFTRLATLVGVRRIAQEKYFRYYFDLRLEGYPLDRDQHHAKAIATELRQKSAIPMNKWVSVTNDLGINALFRNDVTDDTSFPAVVSALGQRNSQFEKDTFWRIVEIKTWTKSLLPFAKTSWRNAPVRTKSFENRRISSYDVVDQSDVLFSIQFHRAREDDTSDYRIRKIRADTSPKSFAADSLNEFKTRAFGRALFRTAVPSTSSLSISEVLYIFETVLHEKDEHKDFPYGPEIEIQMTYTKDARRVFIALFSIACSVGLLAWTAFSTSIPTATFTDVQPLWSRIVGAVVGVFLSGYAYYLWSDDLSVDKLKR